MLLESSGSGAYFETLLIEHKISRNDQRVRRQSDHIVDAGAEEAMAIKFQGDRLDLLRYHWRCPVVNQCLGR